MPEITTKPRAHDVRLSIEMYREAAKKNQTLSQFLESIDPSAEYGAGEKMTAFERQLKRFDIRVTSDPKAGFYADPVEKFYQSGDSAVLFPEWIKTTANQDLIMGPMAQEFIALTTPINSGTYDSLLITDQPTSQRMGRTPEKVPLPVIELSTKDNSIKVKKFGAVIRATYEAIRRMRLDLVAIHLQRIGQQADADKTLDILDVIINGDGNDNAATNYNLTALDTGTTANNLTYAAWIRFLLKFNPHACTTIAADEAELLKILTLQMPTINPLMILSMLTSGQPFEMRVQLAQNLFGTVRLVYVPGAAAGVLTGIDRRYAIEQVQEIGSDIAETNKLILTQQQEIAVSESLGFSKLVPKACRTLTLSA